MLQTISRLKEGAKLFSPGNIVRLALGGAGAGCAIAAGFGILALAVGPATFGISVPIGIALIAGGIVASVGGFAALKIMNNRRDAYEKAMHAESLREEVHDGLSYRESLLEELEHEHEHDYKASHLDNNIQFDVTRRRDVIRENSTQPIDNKDFTLSRPLIRGGWRKFTAEDLLKAAQQKPGDFTPEIASDGYGGVAHCTEDGREALRDYGDSIKIGKNLDPDTMEKAIRKGLELLRERAREGKACNEINVHPPSLMEHVRPIATAMGIGIANDTRDKQPNAPMTKNEWLAQHREVFPPAPSFRNSGKGIGD